MKNDLTKISVRLWTPLRDRLNKMCHEAFIKRDPFMNAVLAVEAPRLRKQLAGRRQSAEAKRYVSRSLGYLNPKWVLVNWQVEKSTAQSINEICEQANACRDAVINRIVLFLTAEERLLRKCKLATDDFNVDVGESRGLELAAWVLADPLQPIHEAFHQAEGDEDERRLYMAPIFDVGWEELGSARTGRDFQHFGYGFSVYLDDAQVPGTEPYQALQARFPELMELFGS